jgi:hypothetical protein
MILLWATEIWHGVHPIYPGLGATVFLFFPHPSIGVVKFGDAIKVTNYSALVLMVAVIALGKAFAHNDDIRDSLAKVVVAVVERGSGNGSDFVSFYLATLAGVPVVWLIATSAASSLSSTIFVQVCLR